MALLLEQHFESLAEITAAGGLYSVSPGVPLTLVPGKAGNALHLPIPVSGDMGAWLTYPTTGHFNIQKGTLEFWIKPYFDMHFAPTENPVKSQYLFNVKSGTQSFGLGIAKTPQAPSAHAYYGVVSYNPVVGGINTIEPYLFCKTMRPDVFSRVRAYWDWSLPLSDAFSLYYDGAGTAYYSCIGTKGEIHIKTNSAGGSVDKVIGPSVGHWTLGQIVDAINAVSGFHATLIGNPNAQGWMVNQLQETLPITLGTAKTYQQQNSYYILQANDTFSDVFWSAPITPSSPLAGDTMGIGCRYDKFYPARAAIDSLKIWDTVELPVIPLPQNFVNPYYPDTVALYDSIFANDGFCSAHETHATQPTDCPILDVGIAPGEDVVFFERPHFQWVLPNYVPTADEIKSIFDYAAIPLGEIETVFFNIYSRIALTNMELNFTALTGPGNIAKENLDLRVVHNWFQAAHDGTVAEKLPVYAPELMLHCDVFGEEIHGLTQVDPQLDPVIGWRVPVFLKLDHVHTKMAAYTAKNFGLTVTVPADATPGSYTGTVTLTATELAEPMVIILNFTVLPFALRDSGSKAMPWLSVYNMWSLCDNTPGVTDHWDCFKKALLQMRAHGLDAVQVHSINDYADAYRSWGTADMPESPHDSEGNFIEPGGLPGQPVSASDLLIYWDNVLRICEEVGMKMVCMYAATQPGRLNLDYTPELVALMESHGFEPWLFGRDEFDWNPANATFPEQVAKARRIHDIGGKCLVDTNSPAFSSFDTYMETDPVIQAAYPGHVGTDFLQGRIYIIGDTWMHDVILGIQQKKPQCYESYYFQTRTLYPSHERYWCGYFRYFTGFDGPQPTHAFALGWQDFGFTEDKPNLTIPYGVIYLAIDQDNNIQFLPTLHGCAMREGFKDDKYLATWKYYKDRVASTHPTEVANCQATVDTILERYKEDYGHIVTPAMAVSTRQFAADRKTIIGEIFSLKNLQTGRKYVGGVNAAKVGGKFARRVAGVKL
jgi:hypothetical protein